MKKWVKVGALCMVMFLFCTGISFAANVGDKGISPLVLTHNGNGPGDGTYCQILHHSSFIFSSKNFILLQLEIV